MDTKKLRQKILDLAIRGKLVPQDPNDEPASVLLERIRAEKEQLIKEGKIKRSKKSAATDKSHYENVPFEIPANWCWTTLGEVFTLKAGKNITAKEISDKQDTIYPFPCYGGNGLRGYVSSYNRTGRYPLIGRQGALCGNINVADGLFYATEHAVVVESYCNIDVDWAVYALIYLNLNQYATSTAQPGLSVATINEVLLPVPPIDEQKRIANEIEKWFDLIKEIESGKVELKSYIKQTKSKILDLAISGKLVPQDPNDEPAIELLKRINPGFEPCDNSHYENMAIPQSWELVSLNSVVDIISGVSYAKSDIKESGVRILRGGNIQDGEIICLEDDVFIDQSYSNMVNSVVKGDIVLVASTGSPTLIGKTGYARITYPDTQIGAFLRIIRPKSSEISAFLNLIFNSDFYKNYIRSLAKGTNINNVKNGYIEQFEIALPPIQEQERIVMMVENIFISLDNITAGLL